MSKRKTLKGNVAVPDESKKELTYIPPPARRGKVMLNVLVSPEARDQIKSITSRNGTTVQAVIRDLMNEYFRRNNEMPIA